MNRIGSSFSYTGKVAGKQEHDIPYWCIPGHTIGQKKRSVKTKQIGTPGFQSESNKTEAYNYLPLQNERPRYMEQRQKLWDTPDNYISAEYIFYDWQNNHCTHVKNWCKMSICGKRGRTLYRSCFSLKIRTWKCHGSTTNDPNEYICRSVVLSPTCFVPVIRPWWARSCTFHLYHHSSCYEIIKVLSGLPMLCKPLIFSLNVELPGSLASLYCRVPKQSADCLKTVKLQRFTAKPLICQQLVW